MLRVRAAVWRASRGFRTFPRAAVEVKNEPILAFREGSAERTELLEALDSLKGRTEEIPCVVGDEHVWTKDVRYQLSPFNHSHRVAKFCYADKDLINKAIEASVSARREWDLKPGKTVVQAEIDAAAELIDFFRFNAKHGVELERTQPMDAEGSTNSMLYRGLEVNHFICFFSFRTFKRLWKQVRPEPRHLQNLPTPGRWSEVFGLLQMYVPDSLWLQIKRELLDIHKDIRVGDVIAGGNCDDTKGYFVEPTIIESSDPQDAIMSEEIFGPVLSVYVYPEKNYKEVLQLIDNTSPYALTGAVTVIDVAAKVLRNAAGNYYVNDKSTGSIVAQQPFGGARVSGTNDKPGGPHYVLRWTSPQVVKETHVPLTDWKYPYMG
ncbi:Delta-1-pyrroline-5-carboxylate dehydrogenase [Nibea albiflora]|uniref:Delta-1-pyrroline-5-carboxylate dehydrogenase n=1 Tax=Nibea albiflora TaxID=240163 RepID=A0ACB7EYB1_NIBAL|nr:Delta-1-pyrroline-5-carboxylate dehydrogenase [Nibea albiflora]